MLTGGLAVELHHIIHGVNPEMRRLNDIDFIAGSFDDLPTSLADDYLFRHIHPLDPPGKTILQAIDPAEALRIDVFRSNAAPLTRAVEVRLGEFSVRLIALADLLTRTARLLMDLTGGVPAPAKHATDFLRLCRLSDALALGADTLDQAWADQRKPGHPNGFTVRTLLEKTIEDRPDLLIQTHYSTDVNEFCERCLPAPKFRLADRSEILSLLGYC